MAYVLHNPFGSRRLDVAHSTIGKGIRKLCESLMEAEAHLPPSMATRSLAKEAVLNRGLNGGITQARESV